jgi:hypothetical protein
MYLYEYTITPISSQQYHTPDQPRFSTAVKALAGRGQYFLLHLHWPTASSSHLTGERIHRWG